MTARIPTIRLVTFCIGDTWYGAEIAFVERVLRREGVHPMPNMPAWIEGVIEDRGRLVPVVDLRQRFGLPPREQRGAERLLLLSLGDDVVAATVDRVVDVRAVAADDIVSPPRLMQGIAGDFLRGMVRRGETMVLVLDVPRLFTADDVRALAPMRERPFDHHDAIGVVAAAGFAADA